MLEEERSKGSSLQVRIQRRITVNEQLIVLLLSDLTVTRIVFPLLISLAPFRLS